MSNPKPATVRFATNACVSTDEKGSQLLGKAKSETFNNYCGGIDNVDTFEITEQGTPYSQGKKLCIDISGWIGCFKEYPVQTPSDKEPGEKKPKPWE